MARPLLPNELAPVGGLVFAAMSATRYGIVRSHRTVDDHPGYEIEPTTESTTSTPTSTTPPACWVATGSAATVAQSVSACRRALIWTSDELD